LQILWGIKYWDFGALWPYAWSTILWQIIHFRVAFVIVPSGEIACGTTELQQCPIAGQTIFIGGPRTVDFLLS
jgi:hypothetical protein